MSLLSMIPVGATIADAWYCIPEHCSAGADRWPTTPQGFEDAVRTANRRADATREQIKASYPANWPDVDTIAENAAAVQAVVDLRWKITYPAESYAGGGASGVDTVIERTKVRHLDEAHWERVAKTRTKRPGQGDLGRPGAPGVRGVDGPRGVSINTRPGIDVETQAVRGGVQYGSPS